MKVFYSVLPERAILADAFNSLILASNRAGILGYIPITIPKMRTDIARDAICNKFLELSIDPNDTLIMLDADHVMPVDVIERLAGDDKPVVTALAFRSNPNEPMPCFWIRENGDLVNPRNWERGVIKAAIVGSGAIAIKRWVLQKLIDDGFSEGFFKYQYHEDGTSSSEEIFFSQVLEQEGIEVFVDTTLEIPHCVMGTIDSASWEQWKLDHPENRRKDHKVSVVIPQKGRQEQFKKAVNSLRVTAPTAEIVVVLDESDTETEIPEGVIVVRCNDGITPVEKWNVGKEYATGDVLMLGANDIEFTPGWLDSALRWLDEIGEGVIGTNDTLTNGLSSSPHYLVSRSWIDKYYGGKLACPLYKMQYIDLDICYKAKKMNRYIWSVDSKVVHKHPLTNSAPVDSVHEQGYKKYYEQDQALFLERQKTGFKVDW